MFPNLKNKQFTDVSTNERVKVIDQFENIAILDNKQRVDVNRLTDKSHYDDFIDPKDFFSQQNYQIFAEKIKEIPDEALSKMEDESIVSNYDPEEERRILENKIKDMGYPDPSVAANRQIEKFKDILDEDIPVMTTHSGQSLQNDALPRHTPRHTTPDPMANMFKNIKRNTDFSITLDIENKIPRIDFIEMMEDSYEISIIDYLSEEFTQKLLEDPTLIKNKIREEIEKIVYKGKVRSEKSIEVEKTEEVEKTAEVVVDDPQKDIDEKDKSPEITEEI